MPSRARKSSAGPEAEEPSGASSHALVIVESPAKAKTILRILGSGYQVKASMGHVRDLPKSKFGVDVENGFRPEYEVVRGRSKVVDDLKKAARGADKVFLAPDPDREGEAIAWHLLEVLRGRGKKADDRFFRVAFNEITASAVRKAFEKPGRIDMAKVDSQQARRILDRIVGYRISPLLWKKVAPGLSAGRVQSVALRLICDREREIREFKAREYWTIDVDLERGPEERFTARVARWNGEKAEIGDEATAQSVVSMLRGAECGVASIRETPKKRSPAPPFITSTLQQAASSALRMSTSQTMMIAQQLYEGIELGERGSVGLITYMRTDAPRVSREAQGAARAFIGQAYGDGYVPERPPSYRARRGAQEAHEAIRPTEIELRPEDVAPFLSRQQLALYRLIWGRFVASQMSPARLVTLTVDIDARPAEAPDTFVLRATSTRVEFDGWLRIMDRKGKGEGQDEETREGDEEGSVETSLPRLAEGDALRVLEIAPAQHFTEPPPRYSEATLVRALEERGIGRPSTYAPTVATIQKRKYVQKVKRRLAPTRLGEIVNELLVNHFPDLVNFEFTARMEDELDRVEQGKEDWRDLLTRYNTDLEKALAKATETMDSVRRQAEPTDIVCDVCGAPMVIRWSRRGEFLSCSKYPECKNAKSFHRRDDGTIEVSRVEESDETCEKCNRPMVIRNGRYGKFLACSGYPECKNTRPLPTNVACPRPGCGGELVQRRSRRKSIFYGCSRYPECDYATRSLDEVTADGQAPDTRSGG